MDTNNTLARIDRESYEKPDWLDETLAELAWRPTEGAV